jgi:hypothetical protein
LELLDADLHVVGVVVVVGWKGCERVYGKGMGCLHLYSIVLLFSLVAMGLNIKELRVWMFQSQLPGWCVTMIWFKPR